MVWALTGWLPTPSTSAAMLAALIRLFPKHNLWILRWARALNFFGRPWRGLFWVEPVLLKCCIWSWPPCCSSVSGSWQSSQHWHQQTAHPHDAIHAVCNLPCTVKSGQIRANQGNQWNSSVKITPLQSARRHRMWAFAQSSRLWRWIAVRSRDPNEDDEHADDLPWDGFWQKVNSLCRKCSLIRHTCEVDGLSRQRRSAH